MTAGFLVTAETDPHEIAAASRCWGLRPTGYGQSRFGSLIESGRET
jgi:hypothetical protein